MTALAPLAQYPRKKATAGASDGRNALRANAFPKWARAPIRALDSMSDVEAAVLAGASLATFADSRLDPHAHARGHRRRPRQGKG